MHKRITSFRGQYAFLSNFYRCTFLWGGWYWSSSEHAFQAAKTMDPWWVTHIWSASTPAVAKQRGREAPLRPGWDDQRVPTMQSILLAKFAPGTELAGQLVDTAGAHLEEGNTWGDTFWGTVNGVGDNYLGLCLMKVREELRVGAVQ